MQADPWGEIRPKAPRTDPEPWNNAVRVGVKNISIPDFQLLEWMTGFTLAFVVAVAWRTFA